MIEKIILLEGVDPLILFGANNININKLTKLFPAIKIIARGNEIKLIGSETEIEALSEKILYLIDYCKKWNKDPLCEAISINDLYNL
jgi:phosphate starvation-inducible PhoH-like protein